MKSNGDVCGIRTTGSGSREAGRGQNSLKGMSQSNSEAVQRNGIAIRSFILVSESTAGQTEPQRQKEESRRKGRTFFETAASHCVRWR